MAEQREAPNPNPNPNPPADQSQPTNEATIESNGPDCSESSVKVPETSGMSDNENPVQVANDLMEKGNIALKDGDFSDASDFFSRALEIRVAKYGELAPECIHSYYKYGHALLNKAQEEADPLGVVVKKKDFDSLQNTATAKAVKNNVDGESSVASVSSNVEQCESSNQQQDADDVSEKNEEDKDGESDVDEDEAEEDETDLDLAWKMLDLARAISEKHSLETTMDMVDILSALAEVSLEREEIDTSLSDYKKALSILEQLVEPDSRLIVELNFRICLTLEVGSRAEEAIPYCQKAITLCKSRIQRLTDELNGISASTPTSTPEPVSIQSENSVSDKQAEIDALSSISSDLEKKLEDLQQLESNPRSILSEILGLAVAKAKANDQAGASATSSRAAVVSNNSDFGSSTVSTAHTNGAPGVTHLGVVGRGVKRVSSGSIESSSGKKPAIEPKSDGGS